LQKLYANEGKKKNQHHVCFTARAQDLQGLKKHLEQNGTKLVDAPKETPGRASGSATPSAAQRRS